MKQLLIRLGANPDTSLPFSGRNVPEYVRRYAGGAPTDVLRLVTNHLVTNHLGTVHLVTNVATGAVIQRLDSDEFGRVFADSNPGAQPFGFAGGLYDPETGLVRFGARDYAPEVGRWTARDPVRFLGGQNAFAYMGNSPLSNGDPGGLWTSPWDLADDAEQRSKDSGLGGENGGPQDALRHCLWSCYMARDNGVDSSKFWGDLHELQGRLCGQSLEDEQMDKKNNKRGRDVAASGADCDSSCMELATNGGLATRGKGQGGGSY